MRAAIKNKKTHLNTNSKQNTPDIKNLQKDTKTAKMRPTRQNYKRLTISYSTVIYDLDGRKCFQKSITCKKRLRTTTLPEKNPSKDLYKLLRKSRALAKYFAAFLALSKLQHELKIILRSFALQFVQPFDLYT